MTLLALLGLVVAASAPFVATSSASAATSTRTSVATAAGFTDSKHKTRSYVSASTIKVSKSRYRGYLQFTTSGVNLQSVVKAELLITPKKLSGTRKVRVLATTATSLSGLTARSAPSLGATLGTSKKLVKGRQATIQLTRLSALRSTTVLALKLTTGGQVAFYKTGTKAPVLRLTTDNRTAGSPGDGAAGSPAGTPPASTASASIGSVPVGSAAYAVPSGAIYVAPLGTSGGDGSLANPYGSVQVALAKAATGATIVLRGGTYHESVEVPFYKALTIQNYPKEAAWFDGASTVTGWKSSGSTWYVSDWNYSFDHSVSFTKGQDQTSWWVNPNYPMAGYPDQVWVNGSELTQVGSAGAVTSGTFFVDTTNKRLVIGTNPSGKTVEASTLQKAITVHGAGSTLRGFGVRHYATTMVQMGAVSVEVANVTLENVVIDQNATIGLFVWGSHATLNRLTLTRNGVMGACFSAAGGSGLGDHILMQNSDVSFNNTGHFNTEPVSGGLKTSRITNGTIANNLFEGNISSPGLWLDEASTNVNVTGNTFTSNGADGLEVEISNTVRVVDNFSINNAWSGIRLYGSQNVDVWNNTASGNAKWSLRIMEDDGRGQSYFTRSVNIRNNAMQFANASCPLVVLDTTKRESADSMGLSFSGNTYQRTSTSAPSSFMCWANATGALTTFNSLASFRSGTGQEGSSVELVGSEILTTGYRLTSTAAASSSPIAVTSDLAQLLGVTAGWKGSGARGAILTR